MNRICGIYKITNLLNGHSYIGQSIDIKRRFKEHFKQKYKCSLYDAFNKYGINNFSFDIIEQCPKELLNEREKYWIKYYNTYYNGYNMTKGGEGGPASGHKKPVIQYDKDGNFIGLYESISAAERYLNIKNSSGIIKVCQGKAFESNGYQWRYLEEYPNYKQNIGKSPLKEKLKENGCKNGIKSGLQKTLNATGVIQYDKNTHQIIEIFNSIKEASQKTGICLSSIYKVCNKTRQSAGGYYWEKI